MTELGRIERNNTLLREGNGAFRLALSQVLAQMQALGWRPRLQCVWRSLSDQASAHAIGISGVTFGFHNTCTPDGHPDALAADVLDDDAPLQIRRPYVLALARCARQQGLDTGILWGLPEGIRDALDQAINTNVEWTGKLGWDPCHVEQAGLSIADARAGVRPGDQLRKTVNV